MTINHPQNLGNCFALGGANVPLELLVKMHIVDKMGRICVILLMNNSFDRRSGNDYEYGSPG